MARTEYYDDPHAPEPNSMVVAASAVVTGSEGRILLQRRTDNDLWALPGGGMDLGDSLPGTAVREVGRQFNICFTARITGGELCLSDESTELRFVAPADVDALSMHHTQRLRVQHFLERRSAPYLG